MRDSELLNAAQESSMQSARAGANRLTAEISAGLSIRFRQLEERISAVETFILKQHRKASNYIQQPAPKKRRVNPLARAIAASPKTTTMKINPIDPMNFDIKEGAK